MDARFADLPEVRAALEAIQAIVDGGSAAALENHCLDFKEESGRRGARGEVTQSPGNVGATAAIAAEEACCLSNSSGGVLMIGVADKLTGPEALIGTEIDAELLREQIWEQTTPRLSVDVHEYRGHGPRLLLVHVRRGYRLHHAKKRGYRQRIGTQCVAMSPEDQRAWTEARTGYDWSAERSPAMLNDVVEGAVEQARDYLRATADDSRIRLSMAPTPELLRRLGVLDGEGRLSNAGALLFTSQPSIAIDYQRRSGPGSSSSDRLELKAPLLLAYAAVKSRLDAVNDERHVQLASGVQPRIRLIPDRAVREAIVNAMCHRDYRSADPISVEFIRNQLIVSSPGGFPPGITAGNIISERSHPRNVALTRVFRSLRLAEQEGVGVDRMYRDMIGAGHDLPEIVDRNGRVRCVLSGGEPEPAMVSVMAALPTDAQDDVDLALTLHTLLRQPSVRADDLAPILQKSAAEAATALRLGERFGLLEQASGGTRALPVMRLSDASREALRPLLPYLTTSGATAEEFVVRHLLRHDSIRTAQLAEMLGVTSVQASRILNDLRARDVVQFGSASRGRNAASVPGAAFEAALGRHGLRR